MPYPYSPFDDCTFDTRILNSLKIPEQDIRNEVELKTTLQWLCTSPTVTSYRVNTLKVEKEVVMKRIQEELDLVLGVGVAKIEHSNVSRDLVIVKHIPVDLPAFKKYPSEVVVDVDCAAAVLRGAHIYAPGVLSMVSGTEVGDKVSIYADLSKKCRKGLLKIYLDPNKVFLGNGIVKMTRTDLFGEHLSPSGVAIIVFEVISGCPPIGNDFFPSGWALLQNIPSICCVNALRPKRNEIVLDMCAAPGNKTTHIAALMENEGVLVAIDKTPSKVDQLRKNCQEFGANVLIYKADSCKIVDQNQVASICNIEKDLKKGPPFSPGTFDKILLDAPCSALGKRPQFCTKISEKVIKSYVPLQRKLFSAAVDLLKLKGTLVYSTCTITLAENEGIVAWALKTFDCLELVNPEYTFGGSGWPGAALSEEERQKVQRFGPNQKVDSVGFFIACFTKR